MRYELGTIVATGIVAGIAFAIFEMFAAAILMGPDAAVMPLRMIGAIVLGPGALDPGYSLAVAATAGVVTHLILSILFTGVFAVLASGVAVATAGDLLSSPGSLALAGVVFGTAIWLVNFYAIAPVAHWAWFPERTSMVAQFLAHAFVFGAPVGWMLGRSRTVLTI
jgi:hypothetical protein